jgi:hypothetical protein
MIRVQYKNIQLVNQHEGITCWIVGWSDQSAPDIRMHLPLLSDHSLFAASFECFGRRAAANSTV